MALQLTVIAQSGKPLEHWSVGLQLRLEKISGVCLVEKLRAIQFYEADFNCFNQFIFGKHAMQTLTESGYIPEELFSQKGSTAEDAKFNKILMADLSRQARWPMIVTSADAAYCYERMNHIIMSLVWLVLTDGNIPAIVAALICLQTMFFFKGQALWQIENICWWSILLSLHDGARPRQQSCSSILDSAKRGFSQCIQAAEPGHFDLRPNNSRGNSFHGDSLCQ